MDEARNQRIQREGDMLNKTLLIGGLIIGTIALIFSLTIPSKIQSYLACKKPIIANINGIGADTIIKSKSGLVSNSGDFQTLANNIETLFEKSKVDLENLAENGFNYFLTNFDRKIIYDKLEFNLLSTYD
jgi:glycosyltransferase involved in cell wall biosynthesis